MWRRWVPSIHQSFIDTWNWRMLPEIKKDNRHKDGLCSEDDTRSDSYSLSTLGEMRRENGCFIWESFNICLWAVFSTSCDSLCRSGWPQTYDFVRMNIWTRSGMISGELVQGFWRELTSFWRELTGLPGEHRCLVIHLCSLHIFTCFTIPVLHR